MKKLKVGYMAGLAMWQAGEPRLRWTQAVFAEPATAEQSFKIVSRLRPGPCSMLGTSRPSEIWGTAYRVNCIRRRVRGPLGQAWAWRKPGPAFARNVLSSERSGRIYSVRRERP